MQSTTDDPIQNAAEVSASRYWKQVLAPYTQADDRRAWFQLATTAAAFAFLWWCMLKSLAGPYWLTILLAVPTTGMMTRLFIFQHDCGHGSFFKSQKLSNFIGTLIGVATLTPYAYWRRTHAVHHATSGNLDRRELGDIDTLTVREYRALSPFGRLKYRLYRNPLIFMTIGGVYQFVIKHRLPLDIPRSWKREWTSVMVTNIGLAAVVLIAWQTIGIRQFLLVQAPITCMTVALGIWLFYVQHQFEDTYWRDQPEWDFHRAGIEGSSFYDLGSVLHWFTGNIGFHHIHHLASRIPNYRLKQAFKEIEELHQVTRLTILGSLHCATLSLWDEEGGRLVGFRHLRRLPAQL